MARFLRKDHIWSLYEGDTFLDVGTIEEISARTGISEANLLLYSNPAIQKRGSRLIMNTVCKIGEVEE